MKLKEILGAGASGYLQDLEDIAIIYDDSIYIPKTVINYVPKNLIPTKPTKKKYYKNDVVYEAVAIVEKAIISKFKKYMNQDIISKRIEPEYIYNFDELCKVIDTLAKLQGKHKVWFKPVLDMDNCWEVNFEELL